MTQASRLLRHIRTERDEDIKKYLSVAYGEMLEAPDEIAIGWAGYRVVTIRSEIVTVTTTTVFKLYLREVERRGLV